MESKTNETRAPKPSLKLRDSWRGALREPSTWAGVATITGALASGGTSVLMSPAALAQIAAGAGLILMREVEER